MHSDGWFTGDRQEIGICALFDRRDGDQGGDTIQYWLKAYDEVMYIEVPRRSNVFSSHFVMKIKVEEEGKMRLKARLCPHVNRGIMKDEVIKDSATAQLDTIRLTLSMSDTMGIRIGCVDVKEAYLQSGSIKRLIYVRPPKELAKRGILWRLNKMPYGITEAGRQ